MANSGGYKPADHVGNTDFTRATVVIIGAGISGLCMAIDLLRRTPCRKFVILEQGSQVGGTWNDNKYPGCACDIWSALYSLSFEQKADWSREYPGQEELLDYLIHVAQKYRLYRYIRFNSAVDAARWDEDSHTWRVQVSVGGAKDGQFVSSYELTSDFLVSAVGQLNLPQWPSLPGLDDFTGKVMHSARWDWTYDWADKRVAIIGNGASALQIAPEIAPAAAHLTVYQRTPNWVIPRMDRRVTGAEQTLLGALPPARWLKRAVMMQMREVSHGLVTDPKSSSVTYLRDWALGSMKQALPGRPDLWAALTPDYQLGCKRILVSDNYYQTLGRENVTLETREVARVTESGIETVDGAVRDVDLIVCATGFRTVEFLHPVQVTGREGRPLDSVWAGGASAYYGVTVEEMPNFGMLYGPNTNLGHNSIILMIEAQSRYLSALIDRVVRARDQGQSLVLQPRTEVVRSLNHQIQTQLQETSFADPTCRSWYKTADGRITNNWPGTAVQYQKELATVRWADYAVSGTAADTVAGRRPTRIGRVVEEWPVSWWTMALGAGAVGWWSYTRYFSRA
ncbi:FAD/NAD(P)-binding domain-containing protein [Aspergillus campestris IBT 28561]|uniref:FAD/NAD(P)-binding domain-containing protein n=1 Tax=Aspergillus campestris (strain IBT 28561) TaxID=1392248 RepID=A0A2I1CQU1_ASPC2|nr:FAD/NAD(P)-binding domain-containing protein [Aspergillus campestris IBT 28561]PKX99987.1 FAD/NAD(P)-binding domain-containing protein [Aspergillus campestris IBT 28561]